MSKGKVWLVGAGPGDPGLLTLKGLEVIKAADCIVYDFHANARLLEYAKEGVEAVYVGKRGAKRTIEQEEINRLIIERAKRGRTVVRLKGGDPFIFGRGAEEALECVKHGIPFEVVPGVTSATAAPAYAGIPLTHRELSSSVTFIAGQEAPIKERPAIAWDRLSIGRGTLVFLMGWKNLPLITKKLLENGWPRSTPAAVIRWGTLTKQVSVDGELGNIVELTKKHGIKPPVVIVVGDVVRLRNKLNWFETKPLFGKRIVVTRTAEQAGAFAGLLESYGAEPVLFPVIKVVHPKDKAPLDRAIKRLFRYDWLIFTSVNGVKFFFERLYKLGRDIRELKGIKICTIGPKTEEAVKELGIRVDLVPEDFRAEGVLKALGKRRIRNKRFLLPRALKAREILPDEIRRLGGVIDVVPAYRTIRPRKQAAELKERLSSGDIDVVTFTSSSTVTNFASAIGKRRIKELLEGVHIACIGPITAKTAEGLGMKVHIVPQRYTIEALTEAMAEFFRSQKT